MTTPATEIRSAAKTELPEVVSTIVAAFITDPIARFALLSPHDYLQGMPAGARAFGGKSFECGTADVSSDLSGAALWLPPGEHPDSEALEQSFRDTSEPAHLDDLLETFGQMDQCHPDEPHWYLTLIGVEPNAQGQGIGAMLMRHAAERCDREGSVAYLESSNPRNIGLYVRHGFEAIGEIQVGKAPVVTPMLRRPGN